MKLAVVKHFGPHGFRGWGVLDTSEKGWQECNPISPLFISKEQAQKWLEEFEKQK